MKPAIAILTKGRGQVLAGIGWPQVSVRSYIFELLAGYWTYLQQQNE
jgi:hypothetical protein